MSIIKNFGKFRKIYENQESMDMDMDMTAGDTKTKPGTKPVTEPTKPGQTVPSIKPTVTPAKAEEEEPGKAPSLTDEYPEDEFLMKTGADQEPGEAPSLTGGEEDDEPGQRMGVEEEEVDDPSGGDKINKALKSLSDKLGANKVGNKVDFDGKTIEYYSETESFVVDGVVKKQFGISNIDELAEFLMETGDDQEPDPSLTPF